MGTNIRFRINLLIVVLFFVVSATSAYCGDAPIHIEANSMTSVEKSGTVVFKGNVDAKQGEIRIRSDVMTVYYTKKDKNAKAGEKKPAQQVSKLICTGNVEVTRGEWLGTAKKMLYLSNERQVILTQNAKAWQGQNMVSGDKIVYFIDEGRSEVIGSTSTTLGKSNSGGKKASRVKMTILQN